MFNTVQIFIFNYCIIPLKRITANKSEVYAAEDEDSVLHWCYAVSTVFTDVSEDFNAFIFRVKYFAAGWT